MFNLFLLLLLLVFIVVSYKKPILGLASIIALLPAYLWRLSIFSLPTTFLELMVVFLFVVWLIKEKKYKKINFSLKSSSQNKVPPRLRWLLLLWLLASLIALAVNPSYAALGLWRAYFLEPIMFFILFVYIVKDKNDLNIIIRSLGILLSWLFVVSLYQNFTSWNFIAAYNYPNPKRLTAVFSYPNALALLVAPLSVFFLALWARAKDKKDKWWYLLVTLFAVASSYLAVSEGALVAIIFSLFVYLILAKKIRKASIPIFLVFFIVLLSFSSLAKYPLSIWQQVSQPSSGLSATSLEIRGWQWRETGLMLQDDFVFGSGINGYQLAMKKYHQLDWIEIYLYPHNIFLNFWVELGLFGLLIFLGLMFYVAGSLKNLFDKNNNFAWPLSLAWLTWFVHGLVDVPYFKNDLSILFFILLAMTIIVRQLKTEE